MQQTLKSLSLLFFPCKESSQQKVFRKVGVSNFLIEILEKHQRRISFFHIIAGCRATFLLQRLIKLASSYQRFQPEPQLATMQGCYFKKHLFFQCSFSSFCRLYCSLRYWASLWTNLLSRVCVFTLKFVFPSLLKLAF